MLRDILGEMGIASDPSEGAGVGEVDVPSDHFGKGVFGGGLGIASEQLGIVNHGIFQELPPTGGNAQRSFGKRALNDCVVTQRLSPDIPPPSEDEEQTVLWGWGAPAPVSEQNGARAPHPHEYSG
jgi:hypothetical protein